MKISQASGGGWRGSGAGISIQSCYKILSKILFSANSYKTCEETEKGDPYKLTLRDYT